MISLSKPALESPNPRLQVSLLNSNDFGSVLDTAGGIQILLPIIEKLSEKRDSQVSINLDCQTSRELLSGSPCPTHEGVLDKNENTNTFDEINSRRDSTVMFNTQTSYPGRNSTPDIISNASEKLSERYMDENIAACFMNILTVANYQTLTAENIVTLGLLFENLPAYLIDERFTLSIQAFREKMLSLRMQGKIDHTCQT